MTVALESRALTKRYGRRAALTDCELSLPAGRIAGLVGPNGAGKTTLIHLAVGLLAPNSGTIEVLGERPASSPSQLARVGFVAQETPALDRPALEYAIDGDITLRRLEEELAEATLPTKAPAPRTAGDSGVEVNGAPDVWVRLSRCCTPVPGDEITGFVTHGHGVSVHRVDCVNLAHLTDTQKERMVDVHWAPTDGSVFLVAIQVEALDRTRLLSDVTRVLSDQHVNILSATVTTSRDRTAFSRFTFEMGDPKHLGHVLRAVRAIDGVYDVCRVTS